VQAIFLLIGHREESPLFHNLASAVADLGELQVLPAEEAMQHILQREYDVVIIDAAAVGNEMLLVSRVRVQQPQARIVVVTASPTWRRAREALRAGAMDYIGKSLSEGEFLSAFKDVLARTPPPWPQ
jgi:DNA-binding NarL/FixJ family response regulator